jgi:hypothetical protein
MRPDGFGGGFKHARKIAFPRLAPVVNKHRRKHHMITLLEILGGVGRLENNDRKFGWGTTGHEHLACYAAHYIQKSAECSGTVHGARAWHIQVKHHAGHIEGEMFVEVKARSVVEPPVDPAIEQRRV